MVTDFAQPCRRRVVQDCAVIFVPIASAAGMLNRQISLVDLTDDKKLEILGTAVPNVICNFFRLYAR
jgi:hypothetical protein